MGGCLDGGESSRLSGWAGRGEGAVTCRCPHQGPEGYGSLLRGGGKRVFGTLQEVPKGTDLG